MPKPLPNSISDRHPHPAIVIMGVCGTGKSSIGHLLAELLTDAWFVEGDDYHPPENIKRLSAGEALTDIDRSQWLENLGRAINAQRQSYITLCSCSALKKSYRDHLRSLSPNIIFIFLDGSKDLIKQRLEDREHFMSPDLLDSQLNTLEKPTADEGQIITCPIDQSASDTVTLLINQHLSGLINAKYIKG